MTMTKPLAFDHLPETDRLIIISKFMAKIEVADCWQWKAGTSPGGYGKFFCLGRYLIASRVSYALFVSSLLDSRYVCHTCDNVKCVNPSHLFLGTQTDNMRDALRKGRNVSSPGMKNCHAKLTDEQVIAIRQSKRPNTDLAVQYGVHIDTISSIRRGKTWRHLRGAHDEIRAIFDVPVKQGEPA